MIKVIQGEDKSPRNWKIKIDGKIIEKVKISSILGDDLDLFGSTKLLNFFSLKN